ncbi:hypothetical protein SLEP1_g50405 [Rubroshorea leprosula]|uniref:Transposase (putative) gypsy type domain-containing protein n=1 Tax=Rubroshorea leprosula TaxID=152421 RepID=A0AAV5M0N1_9ROSI|nr:hypothetical protein SLEP1_g50405 [Rubroshorea leprosula]
MSSEETISDERVKGRFEGVEGRDLGVLLNILEREDEREECFNPEEEIVCKVMGYETSLENRSGLAHLVENYEVPGHVLVRPAGKRKRACSAPRDHWMPFYSHYLAAGLRFPFPNLLVWLLMEYSLGLTQLTPNAMRLIVAFAVYGRSRGVAFPTASVFKYFYVLNAGSGKEKGWYYFSGRVVNKKRRGLFSAGPSSIQRWKDKFFFVDDTEWDKTDAELEDVRMLDRGDEGLLDAMEYTSQKMLDAAEIYGLTSQSGGEMNKFLEAAGGVGIPKKGRGKRGRGAYCCKKKESGATRGYEGGGRTCDFTPPYRGPLQPQLLTWQLHSGNKGNVIVANLPIAISLLTLGKETMSSNPPNPIIGPSRTKLLILSAGVATVQSNENDQVKTQVVKLITEDEDEAIKAKVQLMEETLKSMQGVQTKKPVDISSLCFFPNIQLPHKFKLPEFDDYNSASHPYAHLTTYCRKMTRYANDEKLVIHYFQESLVVSCCGRTVGDGIKSSVILDSQAIKDILEQHQNEIFNQMVALGELTPILTNKPPNPLPF